MNETHKAFITFHNRSKLSNILRIPIKPPSTIKSSLKTSKTTNPFTNPLKSSISFADSSNQLHKRTFTDNLTKTTINKPPGSARQVIKENFNILDHKTSLPNLKYGSETVRGDREKDKTKVPFEKFGINLKALMKMKNNPKFTMKKDNYTKENLNSDVKIKDLMCNMLKRTQKAIEGYIIKELKWKQEKDRLLKEISLLKGIK